MFNNTLGALDKILDDVRKISRIGEFLLHLVFITKYAYSIATSLDSLAYLILYSVLLAVAVSYFIFYCTTLGKRREQYEKRIKKRVAQTVKYIKFAVRVLTIGLAVYEIVAREATDLTVVVLIFTASCFAIQLGIEAIRILTENYVQLLKSSFAMDMEEFQDSRTGKAIEKAIALASNPKAFLVSSLDRPLERLLTSRLSREDGTEELACDEDEALPEPLDEKELARREQIRIYAQRYAEEVAARKQAKEQAKRAETAKELDELKEHASAISKILFRSKKKRNQPKLPE